jgi:hypothetical protein
MEIMSSFHSDTVDIDKKVDAPGGRTSIDLKPLAASSETDAHNSFSADSPYFASYVGNEMRSMNIMNDTLRDISSRTKTFGKCGVLMAESSRRLALACRLRRPFVAVGDEDEEEKAEHREVEVNERRRAVGDDMAGLLAVMSEVSVCFTGVRWRWG